jgi:hypothetical protein
MQPNAGNGPTLPASSYIGGVVMDYSRELGDEQHVAANITQALRLYQSSSLPEETFVNLLHEARRRTRQYQGRQGVGVIENKMAYFFQILRSLVERCRDEDR